MRALRSHNRTKSSTVGPNPGAGSDCLFCICHKPAGVNMFQCSLCLDLFHPSCVPAQHRSKSRSDGGVSGSVNGSGGSLTNTCNRFLCPSCERSRRPRLETILSLLLALQKLPVRLAEAEALQCLTERAMAWQDRARPVLQADDFKHALATLSTLAQKLSDAQLKSSGSQMEEEGKDNESSSDDRKVTVPGAWAQLVASVTDSGNAPLVALTASTKSQLQDLLVEGGLLEVTLEETAHLWRVLQAAIHPPVMLEEALLPLQPSSQDDRNRRVLAKKRKSLPSGENGVEDGGPRSPSKSPKKTKGLKTFIPVTSTGGDKTSNNTSGNKKKLLTDKKRKDQPGGGSGVSNASRKNKKDGTNKNKKSKKSAGSSLLSPSQTMMDDDEDDDDVSDDESCAAQRCQHPIGQNVDWVLCDGCEQWFHYVCVGLLPGDISEDQDYLCGGCKKDKNLNNTNGKVSLDYSLKE